MEDGELRDETLSVSASGVEYDPSLEWPGDGSDMPSTSSSTPYSFVDDAGPSEAWLSNPNYIAPSTLSPSTFLRLVVGQSTVLSPSQTVALLDEYEEMQIGRDALLSGETTPRIRLKEMAVSKLHATIYWDKDRHEWAVVDMGSMHGTFYIPASSSPTTFSALDGAGPSNWSADAAAKGTRLSSARTASIPRPLSHGDQLSLGNTTFIVHIHPSGLPCEECSLLGSDEIPLFDHLRSKKRKRLEAEAAILRAPRAPVVRDPKKAMSMLKRNLLARHVPATPSISNSSSTPYRDRSARRRALHTDAPDPPSRPPLSAPIALPPGPTPVVSAPAAPLPSSNIGHKLLMKQGWQPGTGLGASDGADADRGAVVLIEPLNVSGNVKRTGLGMATPAPSASAGRPAAGAAGSWREEAKLRRWASVRAAEQSRT